MAFDVLGQRNRGVYKLLRITPVRTPVFIVRLALARSIVALGCTLFVLAAGLFILGVPFSLAGLPMLFVVLALGMVAFTFLGFIIGNLGNDESGVATLTNAVTLPLLFLTETFYSLDGAPHLGTNAAGRAAFQSLSGRDLGVSRGPAKRSRPTFARRSGLRTYLFSLVYPNLPLGRRRARWRQAAAGCGAKPRPEKSSKKSVRQRQQSAPSSLQGSWPQFMSE